MRWTRPTPHLPQLQLFVWRTAIVRLTYHIQKGEMVMESVGKQIVQAIITASERQPPQGTV